MSISEIPKTISGGVVSRGHNGPIGQKSDIDKVRSVLLGFGDEIKASIEGGISKSDC
jgi:hypothetical protein